MRRRKLTTPTKPWHFVDYRQHRVDFATFYGSLGREAGITIGPTLRAECVAARTAGDGLFNTIPLRRWDNLANAYELKMLPTLLRAGVTNSLATRVCVLKAVALLDIQERIP